MKGRDIISWFKDGISIDETKFSVLAFAFLMTLGFSLWQFAHIGNIDESILTLILYEIGAITGINIVDSVTRNKRQTEKVNDNIGE